MELVQRGDGRELKFFHAVQIFHLPSSRRSLALVEGSVGSVGAGDVAVVTMPGFADQTRCPPSAIVTLRLDFVFAVFDSGTATSGLNMVRTSFLSASRLVGMGGRDFGTTRALRKGSDDTTSLDL